MKIHAAPLVQTLAELQSQIDKVHPFLDTVDVDIVDWQRTPLKTLSWQEALEANFYELRVWFDLMMDAPGGAVESLVRRANVDMIIINLECKENTLDLINFVQSQGKLAGISVNPEVKLIDFEHHLNLVNHVQIMTVEPGVQGNPFLRERLELITEIKDKGFEGTIGIDGAFNEQTASIFAAYPIDTASVGSALSKSSDVSNTLEDLYDAFAFEGRAAL